MKIISYWTRSLVFNGNTLISTYFHFGLLPIHLKLWLCGRQMAQYISWSQGCSTSLLISKSIPWTSTWCEPYLIVLSDSQVYCCFWTVPSVIQPYNLHFKVQMASFRHNSSTLVPPLGTSFNTILCFSGQMAYLLNAPWCSRQIHQRGHSCLRSPSSTIQPSQTVLSVPSLSIISADNDPNWENVSANSSTNNNIANRPTSSTYS